MKLESTIYIYLLSFFLILVLPSCSHEDRIGGGEYPNADMFNDLSLTAIYEETAPSLVINEGYISKKADTLRIVRDKETVAIVILSEPQIVAQAEEEEIWGYFQFPDISRIDDNNLLVSWSMKEDSHTAYGEYSSGMVISKDEGETWEKITHSFFLKSKSGVELTNGDYLQTYTPASIDISGYVAFPKPVSETAINGYRFYPENELPEELKGVYLEVYNKDNHQSSIIHAELNDPGLLRYAINDLMPIVWWGDIKMIDNSLITGVYGTFYQNQDKTIQNWGISFYKSIDNGNHWDILGKIPFQIDGFKNEFVGGEGFGEPTIEILNNGTIMCVMRTGSASPMYKSFSKDGLTWSKSVAFIPNGVRPSLFLLDNGVLCLASGRPGLQLRFNIDGDGDIWTEPIEMLPLVKKNGNYDYYGISCGYPSVLMVNKDTFYLVYSDFLRKNKNGDQRKSILFRKIAIFKNDTNE